MRRLILGPGPRYSKQDGDVLLDLRPFPGVDVVHDLDRTPWPFGDGEFLRVDAIHVVEHLRSLVSFMDEAWRVLAPGGSLYLRTPLAGVDPDLEWADPTHVRSYRIHTFANYFSPEGVETLGYTDKAWNFFVLRLAGNDVEVHAYPVKVLS